MQAIEFWSVLAEIELLLKEEEEEVDGVTSHVEMECKRFLERCATELVPKLLDMLTLQNEEQDDEDTEWYDTSPVEHPKRASTNCVGRGNIEAQPNRGASTIRLLMLTSDIGPLLQEQVHGCNSLPDEHCQDGQR